MSIRLIIGLGNPGEQYADTRHNAGYWFVDKVARHYQTTLRPEVKFKSLCGSFVEEISQTKIYLIKPLTFMNHSGQAVKLISDFYDISPEEILAAHDELDIPAGDIRLKYQGGHGGHNGLRDMIHHLHSHDFYRLRIGIGHPGIKNQVTDFVLSRPSRAETDMIDTSLDTSLGSLKYLCNHQSEKAMQLLNTKLNSLP